jgi:hypothetical protein
MSEKELSHLEAQPPIPVAHSIQRQCAASEPVSEDISCSECISRFLAWAACDVLLPMILVLLWNVIPAIIFVSLFYLAHFLLYANPYHTTDGTRPFAVLVVVIAFVIACGSSGLNSLGIMLSRESIFRRKRSLITAKVVSYGLLGLFTVGWIIVAAGFLWDGINRNYFHFTESE